MAKQFKKTRYEKLFTAAKTLNTEPADLVEKIGYSRAVVSHWARAGAMPFVAGLACEALLRRSRDKVNVKSLEKTQEFTPTPLKVVLKQDHAGKLHIIGGDGFLSEIVPDVYLVASALKDMKP